MNPEPLSWPIPSRSRQIGQVTDFVRNGKLTLPIKIRRYNQRDSVQITYLTNTLNILVKILAMLNQTYYLCGMNTVTKAESALTTEEKIKLAAQEVFLEKGYDGATTRDIADQMGMNRALMNYYFRTKDKLFDAIFDDLLGKFFASTKAVLITNQPLQDKIKALIDSEFESLSKNPKLATLIIGVINRNPTRYRDAIKKALEQPTALFAQQLAECIQQGKIRPISADQLLDIMHALTWSLFQNKSIRMELQELDEASFLQYARNYIEMATNLLLAGLFIPVPT